MAGLESTVRSNSIGLPAEIVSSLLFHSSTPTFIQLTRTSKEFYDCAKGDRELILHHLKQVTGPKDVVSDPKRSTSELFMILRQRAANNLYGTNFTANLTEYVARDVKLNLNACSISGLDADYVRLALCYADSADIRQYTANCVIKEKIKQTPGTKILRLVQWGRFVSVLCAWPRVKDYDFSDDDESSDDTDSESEVLAKRPFPPSANAYLQSKTSAPKDSKIRHRLKPLNGLSAYDYRVCHYDIYTLEDSQTFVIDSQSDLVPRDFAVQNCLQCAILWDEDNPSGRRTASATLVSYTALESQLYYPTTYQERTIWPKKKKESSVRSSESDDDEPADRPPERIAFFKDGRRIKMYDAGGILPYKVFASYSSEDERFSSTNVIKYGVLDLVNFQVDTPFYGIHSRHAYGTSDHDYCYYTHLCLGMSRLKVDNDQGEEVEVNVLCILRSLHRLYPEHCDHRVSLQRMVHISATHTSAVARLWGWEELHTNLTGQEVVAISPGGTRIAIALWNKVLVYAINPKVLCEETVVDSSDEERLDTKKKKKKIRKAWEHPATDYYQRAKDYNICDWNLANLKPVVIDLKGAVAHKMHWSAAKGIITDTASSSIDTAQVEAPSEESTAPIDIDNSATSSDSASDTIILTPTTSVTQQQPPAEIVVDDPMAPIEAVMKKENTETVSTTVTESNEVVADAAAIAELKLVSSPHTQASTLADETMVMQSIPGISSQEDPALLPSPTFSADGSLTISFPNLTLSDSLSDTSHPPAMGMITQMNPTVQTPKPSQRKKEKMPEVSCVETLPGTTLNKDKLTSGYAVTDPYKKSSSELSVPPSPALSKGFPKPKQTVAEALSNDAAPLSSLTGISITAVEASIMSNTAAHEPTNGIKLQCAETEPINAPIAAQNRDEKDLKPEKADCSKAVPSPNATSQSSHVDAEEVREKEITPKRKKRISEDELVILTDRGIQIWNLGARAKGLRPRPRPLPLEEELAGRVPRLKQKLQDRFAEKQADTPSL